jgi:hypothetical protein
MAWNWDARATFATECIYRLWQLLFKNRSGKTNETHYSGILTGAKPFAVLVKRLALKDLSQFAQEE